jgi:hypothetical protein
MEPIEGPSPHMNFITGLMVGFLFLGIAGSLAWMFYQTYISKTSKVGFADEQYRFYIKDIGTVVSKEINGDTYNIVFTYPDKQGAYQGVKQVSRSEYEESQPGDKFSIFYNPADPGKWLLPNRGKIGWGAVALLIAFSVIFLLGVFVMIQTVRAFFASR